MHKYKKYEDVPWFRKDSINSAMMFVGLVIPPAIWLVMLNLITGKIYQNHYDDQGNLRTWSKGNKIAAWILLVISIISFYLAFTFES